MENTQTIHPNLKPSDLELAFDVASQCARGRRAVYEYAFALLLLAGNGGEAGRAAFDALAEAELARQWNERRRVARCLAQAKAVSRRA